MKKLAFLIPVLIIGAAFAGSYDSWSYYRDITVNTTSGGANVPGLVTNFPLLIRLSDASVSAGADVLSGSLSSNGADIRFTDSTGNTVLSYQIDNWSGSSAAIWVLAPNIAGNASTKIRMYWGKSAQASLSNGGSVFDTANGFRSVWHMGDVSGQDPRPNAIPAYASLTAIPRGYPSGYNPAVSGVIGSADTLLGGQAGLTYTYGTYMIIDSGTATDAYNFPDGKFTVSFWANHTRFGQNKRHFHMQSNAPGSANPAGAIQTIPSTQTPAANMYFRYSTSPAGTNTYQGSNTGGMNLTLNTWMHITCVVSRGPTSDTLYKYYNGVLNGTGTVIATAANPLPNVQRNYVFFGRAFESATDSAFAGSLDEMEFANASRSPDWIKLSYETQKPGATAVALGVTATPVAGAPFIASNPVSKTVLAGSTVKFGVVASGNATLVYKWVRRNTDTVGTNSDSLTLTNVSNADTGSYKCVVRNGVGQAVSGSATLAMIIAPAIIQSPAGSSNLNPGAGFAKFGVKATGTALAYQWIRRKNSVFDTLTSTGIFSGATTDSLTVTNPLFVDSGSTFKCRVSNAAGSAVSDSAMLKVLSTVGILPGKSTMHSFEIQSLGSSVKFHLPTGLPAARISVMDIWGRTVWSQSVGAGITELEWNGQTSQGTSIHGVYVARLTLDVDGKSRTLAENEIMVKP